MKNKGFTLTELLGVIIILSILVLLVFPKVYNSVKSNKNGDKVVEKIIYNATSLYMDDNSDYYIKDQSKTYCIKIKDLVDNDYLKAPVKYKDKRDITNYMTVKVTYNDGFNYEIVNNEDCLKSYNNGEVVYFNVDKGMKCNNYTETQSNTGVNSGCMKFYAFNDDGSDKVNLILDHNTTATIAWNSSGSNVNGPSEEFLNKLNEDTKDWIGTEVPTNYSIDQSGQGSNAKYTVDYSSYKARLITAGEVAQITGNTTWNEKKSTSFFRFDTNTKSESATCKRGDTSGCKYGWLYDRTDKSCTSRGCLNNSDVATSGYWTISPDASYPFGAWNVCYASSLASSTIDGGNSFGVRPVIEVLKSKLD